MATFEDAFAVAVKQIKERGLLLNVQLLNVADGDEVLSQEIRAELIGRGYAKEGYGVGLVKSNQAPIDNSHTPTRSASPPSDSDEVTFESYEEETDWWLMSGGVTHGPFSFSEMRLMRRRGEIRVMDLVRQGERGTWQSPDTTEGLIDVSDLPPPVDIDLANTIDEPVEAIPGADPAQGQDEEPHVARPRKSNSEPDTIPEPRPWQAQRKPETSAANAASNDASTTAATAEAKPSRKTSSPSTRIKAANQTGSRHKARLWAALIVTCGIVLLIIWYRQPPSAAKVYQEFETCHQKLAELRSQRPSESNWTKAVATEQQRIRHLRDGLKTRASSNRPAEQELLWACDFGLLPILEKPGPFPEREQVYAMHMTRALRMIDPAKASANPFTEPGPSDGPSDPSPVNTR